MKKMCLYLICILFFVYCQKINLQQTPKQTPNTITVLGTGTIMVQPDMVQMSVSLSYLARQTRQAQVEVNKMVLQVLAILHEQGIEEQRIMTTALNFRTEYNWNSGRREVSGQRAEQVIHFTIDHIDQSNDKISLILDQLTLINGIELNNMSFSIDNNTANFAQSRSLAFQKATEKANQYAQLSGSKIKKVLSITEDGVQQYLPTNARLLNNVMLDSAETRTDIKSAIPTGEIEITTRIAVVFAME